MKYRWILMIVAPTSIASCSSLFGEDPSDDCAQSLTCPVSDASLADGGEGGKVDGGNSDAPVSDSSLLDGDTASDAGLIDSADAFVCDPAKAPSDEPCVIADAYGIFVAPSGDDTNAGTKSAPVKTLAHALTIAGAKRVYMCSAAYAEPLSIGNATNAVSIYGGFACPEAIDGGVDAGDAGVAAWIYVAGKSASLNIAAPTYALRIDGMTKPVHLEDLAFSVGDATLPGDSSIAGFVSNSTDVTLKRVSLTAGNGVSGAPGTTPTPSPLPAASDGSNAGAATTCPCPNGVSSVGGKGGTKSGGGDLGAPTLGGGAGGVAMTLCSLGGKGGAGADGAPSSAAAAATKLGSVTSAGWSSSVGAAGGTGSTAQGGGGGNSLDDAGTGGGGACGGCGGAPASAPTGGGSSIALLVFESKVNVSASKLNAKDAGAGGSGVAGQTGASGGNGGNPSGAGGCLGGAGGKGGDGAPSSGGAGGVSVGVLVKSSTAPVIDSATTNGTTLGKAGAAGIGGAASNNGPAGVSVAELQP